MFSLRKSLQNNSWILQSTLIFSTIRVISLLLHYYGYSPYGGPLVEEPRRLVFNAIAIELGVILALVLIFRLLTLATGIHGKVLKYSFSFLSGTYLIFTQIDLEFVRWLGEHLTLSFIQNYFRATDGVMLGALLKSDIFGTFMALMVILVAIIAAIGQTRKPSAPHKHAFKIWSGLVLVCLILIASPVWLIPSEKRWRRIQPVVLSIGTDLFRQNLGLEKPRNPQQAYADLLHFSRHGNLASEPIDSIPKFPLLHHGPGTISATDFIQLPRSQRPNIVFLTFETWRGWKTGLVPDTTLPSFTPILDSIIQNEALYFPYTHSLGYPSVEGTQNLHLGTWPHFRKIIISSYGSINWKSLAEIFQDFGYKTEIFVGADPSFSNLSPWFTRWYNYVEYSEKYTQDGPLIERFIQALDTIDRKDPFFLSTWTVTTHPPYTIPLSEGIPMADTDEERYDQAIVYAEKQIVKLIDYLKQSDLWENTILVMVGDHAQPPTDARFNTEVAGNFTPGHTWVHLAFLGGWPGLPTPQLHETTVSLIDVAPTLLEKLDMNDPTHIKGNSLLEPFSKEMLSFRQNSVAFIHEEHRVLFEMFSSQLMYFKVNKNSKRDYALLSGHQAKQSDEVPWDFPIHRYRDMIFAYGELLDQNRIFPFTERKRGVYQKR